jgi:branched-chain amino acid transport system substrate-binding protein
MVEVLEMCGDELTRENIVKQATNLKDVIVDLALPRISLNTTRPITAGSSNFR